MSEELGENKNCTCNQRQSHKWNGNECVVSPPGMSLEEVRRLQAQYNQAAWNSLIANAECTNCPALQAKIREKDAVIQEAQDLITWQAKWESRVDSGLEVRLHHLKKALSQHQQAQSEKSE